MRMVWMLLIATSIRFMMAPYRERYVETLLRALSIVESALNALVVEAPLISVDAAFSNCVTPYT